MRCNICRAFVRHEARAEWKQEPKIVIVKAVRKGIATVEKHMKAEIAITLNCAMCNAPLSGIVVSHNIPLSLEPGKGSEIHDLAWGDLAVFDDYLIGGKGIRPGFKEHVYWAQVHAHFVDGLGEEHEVDLDTDPVRVSDFNRMGGEVTPGT